jgi:hypothetical protein
MHDGSQGNNRRGVGTCPTTVEPPQDAPITPANFEGADHVAPADDLVGHSKLS